MESEVNGDHILLTINPIEGSYAGMPSTRNFRFEIALTRQPLSVKAAGEELIWRFGKDGFLRFDLSGKPVDQTLQVEISLGDETGSVPAGVFGKTGLPDPPRVSALQSFSTSESASKPRLIPVSSFEEEVIY